MTFTSLLVNTCDVERYTEGAIDEYGHKDPTWTAHIDGAACRLMSTKGVEITVGAEVVIADYKLFIGSVDITEQDRVVVDSITYEILSVADRQDSFGSNHKECFMRTVR